MVTYRRSQWLVAVSLGTLMVVYPRVVLGFTAPEPYEAEILRWAGLAMLGCTAIWPWAVRMGGRVLQRLRRWMALSFTAAVLFVVTTSPLLLIVAFTLVAAGVLDATAERALAKSRELFIHIREGT
jgi:hypothetical protein